MNKPVIFKFKSQKDRYNTYLYFANDKRFPYQVYTTAFEIIIDIPEDLVSNFIRDLRLKLKDTKVKMYYDNKEITKSMYKHDTKKTS